MARRLAAAWLPLISVCCALMNAAAQTPDNWNPHCPTCRRQQGVACPDRPGVLESCVGLFKWRQLAECKQALVERCDQRSCSYGKGLGDMGCTSWRQTNIFVFGSCWDFFEEPCRRVPRR
jgi:hypothetical protein